ncbi:MAG: c-type cytochrome [Pseudomonadota bacterium]
MLKSLKAALLLCGTAVFACTPAASAEVAKGEKIFNRCKACHAVGDGAKHKVGPHLNDSFARAAGTAEGYKYSKAMTKAGEDGLVWNDETLDAFLTKPKSVVKKTKMVFAGLRKEDDRANVIAYLKTFSEASDTETEASEAQQSSNAIETTLAASSAPAAVTKPGKGSAGRFRLGRVAMKEEVAAWDIDIRPDGVGLPVGKGSVALGEPIYTENCASCHGDFGEGIDRWPVLAGGFETLTEERPEKTVGSYWPYLSTVYDYVRRAMPFGNARSLSDDDVYALTAYLLYLNDIVEDEDFELSNENFAEITLPNEGNFIDDDRYSEPHYVNEAEPCMTDCKPDPAVITMRARVLDVTPEGEGEGGID